MADPHIDTAPLQDEHPRGTLALVILMGLFFAIGWIVMYFWTFMERGAVHAH